MNQKSKNSEKTLNSSSGVGDLWWISLVSYHVVNHLQCQPLQEIKVWFNRCKLDLTNTKLDSTHMKFDLIQVRSSKMANDMLKSKIDPNLVVFSFRCKSLCLNGRAMTAVFCYFLVISDIQGWLTSKMTNNIIADIKDKKYFYFFLVFQVF